MPKSKKKRSATPSKTPHPLDWASNSSLPNSSFAANLESDLAETEEEYRPSQVTDHLPSQATDRRNTPLIKRSENRDFSVQHDNMSPEVLKSMANMALDVAAQGENASDSRSGSRDVVSKAPALKFENPLPNANASSDIDLLEGLEGDTIIVDCGPRNPPNPFRVGKVKVKHNMSPEEVKDNIARELAAAAASNKENSTHLQPSASASSSTPNKNKKKKTPLAKPAASVEKQPVVTTEEEDNVETIYNPDATKKIPIRIYVSGEDPNYVCPTPLQWKKELAAKWEEEKEKFRKRGLTKIREFAGEDRSCVYYYEWVSRGPNKERICQWILYKEKGEGRTNKRVRETID